MNKAYWDNAYIDNRSTILNVFKEDRKRLIRSWLLSRTERSTAADFGCGIGRGLKLIATQAERVYAIDLSGRNLELARHRSRALSNIHYVCCDLEKRPPSISPADYGLAINLLISPTDRVRDAILGNIWQSLKPGALLLIVVPSLESCIWTYNCRYDIEVRKRKGKSRAARVVERFAQREVMSLPQGIVRIDDVPTKFYLSPEVSDWLRKSGFKVLEKKQLEYGWPAELGDVPVWFRRARPWHWLAIARRARRR